MNRTFRYALLFKGEMILRQRYTNKNNALAMAKRLNDTSNEVLNRNDEDYKVIFFEPKHLITEHHSSTARMVMMK